MPRFSTKPAYLSKLGVLHGVGGSIAVVAVAIAVAAALSVGRGAKPERGVPPLVLDPVLLGPGQPVRRVALSHVLEPAVRARREHVVDSAGASRPDRRRVAVDTGDAVGRDPARANRAVRPGQEHLDPAVHGRHAPRGGGVHLLERDCGNRDRMPVPRQLPRGDLIPEPAAGIDMGD